MKQKMTVLLFFMMMICFAAGCKSSKQEVYYENLESNEKLSENMIQLLEENEMTDGVKLYQTETDGVYECLLYCAYHKGENRYEAISVKPLMQKDVLKLDIHTSDAGNESEIKDELCTYMILKEEPKQIEVLLNGERAEYGSVENVDGILK